MSNQIHKQGTQESTQVGGKQPSNVISLDDRRREVESRELRDALALITDVPDETHADYHTSVSHEANELSPKNAQGERSGSLKSLAVFLAMGATAIGLGAYGVNALQEKQRQDTQEWEARQRERDELSGQRAQERIAADKKEKSERQEEFISALNEAIADGSLKPEQGVVIIGGGVRVRRDPGIDLDNEKSKVAYTTKGVTTVEGALIFDNKILIANSEGGLDFISTNVIGQTDEKTGNPYGQFVYPEDQPSMDTYLNLELVGNKFYMTDDSGNRVEVNRKTEHDSEYEALAFVGAIPEDGTN